MNKPLFITACILAFITVLIYSFVASAIYKKTTCQNSPYYFCDTAWQCCSAGQNNCLASKSNVGATLGIKDSALGSYAITDVYYGGKTPSGGTNDYQKYCVDPVNAMVAQYPGVALNLGCIYDAGVVCSPAGVQTYMEDNGLVGGCNYTKFDKQGYYPSTGAGDGNWKENSVGYSSAYPAAYNGLNGTNTKPYSCFNSLYGGQGYDQC